MEKKKVPNTTKQVHEDPMGFLAEAFVCGTGNAVENQESRGQKDLCNSSQLPLNGIITDNYGLPGGDQEVFEGWGIKITSETVKDIFLDVELPSGWKIEPTEHSMWSNLVDDKGQVRAKIFYKAAFYDRSAHINPCHKYSASADFLDEDGKFKKIRPEVIDSNGNTMWAGEYIPYDYTVSEGVYAEAKAKLEELYPNHKDYNAYWE